MKFEFPFKRKEKTIAPTGKVSAVVERAVIEEIAAPFKYVRTWTCSCGNDLRIRARDHREDGPSNFKVNPDGTPALTEGELNWNGLAEARSWRTVPDIKCPACVAGLSTLDYKIRNRARAMGISEEEYRKLRDEGKVL